MRCFLIILTWVTFNGRNNPNERLEFQTKNLPNNNIKLSTCFTAFIEQFYHEQILTIDIRNVEKTFA